MRNVFCIRKNGGQPDGGLTARSSDAFVDRSADGDIARKQREFSTEGSFFVKRTRIFLWLTIVFCILFAGGFFILVELLDAGIDSGFGQVIENAPWALPVGVPLAAVGGIGLLSVFVLSGRFQNSVPVRNLNERAEKLEKECYEALGVPENAPDIDVFAYQVKNGSRNRASRWTVYRNVVKKVFREGDAVCFADTSDVVKIPLEQITQIVKTDKRIYFNEWNKQEKFNKGVYKAYKIRCGQYGTFSVKGYYVLQIASGSEQFEILIPCYDIEPVLTLTGKQIA